MSKGFQQLDEQDAPEDKNYESHDTSELENENNEENIDIHQLDCVAPSAPTNQLVLFQCFCIFFYSCTSIAITLFNKWLLSEYNFRFPIAMIFYQFLWISVGSWLMIFLFYRDKYSKHDGWISKMKLGKFCRTILPLSLFLCFDIVFTQLGLMLSSVTLSEIIKSLIPVFVFITSILFGLQTFSWSKTLVIAIITIGIGLTSKGEKDLKMIGLVFFVTASICATLKLLFIEHIVGDKHMGMPALLTLAYISTISLPLLLVGFLAVEMNRLVESQFFQDPTKSIECVGWLTVGATLAFLLNISEIMLIGSTSAVTTCVVGITKVIVLMLLSQVIFGPDLNQLKTTGVIVTLIAVFGYNLIKLQERHEKKKLQKYSIMDIPGDTSYMPLVRKHKRPPP